MKSDHKQGRGSTTNEQRTCVCTLLPIRSSHRGNAAPPKSRPTARGVHTALEEAGQEGETTSQALHPGLAFAREISFGLAPALSFSAFCSAPSAFSSLLCQQQQQRDTVGCISTARWSCRGERERERKREKESREEQRLFEFFLVAVSCSRCPLSLSLSRALAQPELCFLTHLLRSGCAPTRRPQTMSEDAAWDSVKKSMYVESNRKASFTSLWNIPLRRKCNPKNVRDKIPNR